MKLRFKLISSLIISCALFLACNDNSNSSDSNNGEKIETNETLQNEISVEENSESTENIIISEHENEISFKSAKWYINSGNPEIFTGLNSSLMSGIILNYTKKNHIDPKDERDSKDSIFVDLENSKFSFYRKTVSELSLYDIEYQLLDDRIRIQESDEELSDEELSKREKEKQIQLDEINPDLKKIETYDVHVIKGTYQILQIKNDFIELKLKGVIKNIDAFSFRIYGENGPIAENHFSDKSNIDLMAAFNDVGRIYKFTNPDLQIINNQALKYIRNQFFARAGYIFKTEAMKEYFSSKSWYTPEYDDASYLLSPTEKYNVELIKKLEEELK